MVHRGAGKHPYFFISMVSIEKRRLGIFVGEGGDFGPADPRSPLYVVAFVFHCALCGTQLSTLEFALQRKASLWRRQPVSLTY